MRCANCNISERKADMLKYEGEYYCSDCATHCDSCGAVKLRDDLQYIPSEVEIVCQECLENDYFYCEDCGEYYHNDDGYYIEGTGLYVCGRCRYDHYCSCDRCGNVFYEEDIGYCDEDDCYYCPDCMPEQNLFGYHSGEGRGNKSNGYRYRVGIEVEKEDDSFLSGVESYDFLDKTGWALEHDSSLDYGGFEAVSPVYPLKITELQKIFNDKDISSIVNARYSCSCGGHITISDVKRTPDEIIDDIGGYLPLLYALFPKRTTNHYCSVRNKEAYKSKSFSRGALNKRGDYEGDGLEIRLFDTPKDVDDVMNRFRLVKFMLSHKARTVEEGLRLLSDTKQLRKIVKSHLDKYNIAYKDFYSNLVKYAREIDSIILQGVDIEDIDRILNR